MNAQSQRRARYPGFWRKKVALLGGLRELYVASSVEHLFDALARLLRREFQAEHVLFSLLDPRREEIFYRDPEWLSGRRLSAGTGYAQQALLAGRCLLIEAPTPPSEPRLREALGREPRTALAAPLIRKERALGVVELIDRSDGSLFSGADQEYLEALSRHMALSLSNFLLAAEAERKLSEQRQLREIARSLNSTFDLDDILEEILLRVREVIEFEAAALILLPPPEGEEGRQKIAVYGYNLQDQLALEEKAQRIQRAWTQGQPEARLLSRSGRDDIYTAIRSTTRSEMLVPLRSRDQLLGLITLVSDQEQAYSHTDLELLEAFGHQISLAVERARSHASLIEKSQLDQELKIAREIQLRFLPERMPRIRGLELAALNVPSRHVSGDLYDLIPIVPGQWGMVIGDVTGKGISAGLIMAAFRAALLAEIRNNFSICTILAKLNRLLWETTDPGHFVTAFYGVYDENERVLTYSNAGHNPPLLLRSRGGAEWLSEGGMILGAFRQSHYLEQRIHLEEGDWLVLYTDGLTEARTPEGEELGEERIEALVRRHRGGSASEMAAALADAVVKFSGRERPEDDATLLVVRALTAPQLKRKSET